MDLRDAARLIEWLGDAAFPGHAPHHSDEQWASLVWGCRGREDVARRVFDGVAPTRARTATPGAHPFRTCGRVFRPRPRSWLSGSGPAGGAVWEHRFLGAPDALHEDVLDPEDRPPGPGVGASREHLSRTRGSGCWR
jgi:hypothetical protein